MARELLLNIPLENLDHETLIEITEESDNPNVCNAARRLLLNHFPEKLDYETLIEFQESDDPDVCIMAWGLLEKIKNDGSKIELEKIFKECFPSLGLD